MMYHVVLDHSRHIELDRLTILAPRGSPNTDGVDVHSTEWVHMHDCTVCNGDDAVDHHVFITGAFPQNASTKAWRPPLPEFVQHPASSSTFVFATTQA